MSAHRYVFLVLVAALARPVRADTLVTKNGARFKGVVVRQRDSYVLTTPRGSRMTFPVGVVKEVIKTTPAAGRPAAPSSPIRPGAQRKPGPWRQDWVGFGKAIDEAIPTAVSAAGSDGSASSIWQRLSRSFNGQLVEWQGTVRSIVRSGVAGCPEIHVAMKPLAIATRTGKTIVADRVKLLVYPFQQHAWSAVREGSVVTFKTVLTNQGHVPCVVGWSTVFPYGGPWLQVYGQGAVLVEHARGAAAPTNGASARRLERWKWVGTLFAMDNSPRVFSEDLPAGDKRALIESMVEFVLIEKGRARTVIAKPFRPAGR